MSHETATDTSPYVRQTLNNLNRNYKRWLVVLDISPDAGPINGFQQIDLPFRTLNVVGKRTLSDALRTVLYGGREMHFLTKPGTRVPLVGVRFSFCLIDMTTQQTVSVAQVQDWATNDSLSPRQGDTALQTHADLVRAVILANSLTGPGVLRHLLLDGNDPVKILRIKHLFPYNADVPDSDAVPDVFAGAVSSEEYTEAVRRAHVANNTAWIAALPSLPSVLDATIEHAVQTQSASIVETLMRNGVPDSSPRLALVRLSLEQALAKVSRTVYRMLYRKIVTGNINFLDPDLLEGVVLAVLSEVAWNSEDLPRFLRVSSLNSPTPIAA